MRGTILAVLFLSVMSAPSFATDAIEGRWKTLDDESGKAMSIVHVTTADGKLSAKVVETLDVPSAKCSKCSGADKGKPIVGMRVLWDLTRKDGAWGGGNGFKPSSGDSFKAKSAILSADGKTLEVTGCKLMFCRTARWVRDH